MDPVLNWLEIFTLLCSLCTIVSVMLLLYDSDGNNSSALHQVLYWINVISLYVGFVVCMIFGLYKIITTWIDLGSQTGSGKISPPDSELGGDACSQVDNTSPEEATSVSQQSKHHLIDGEISKEEKHEKIRDESRDHLNAPVQDSGSLQAAVIGREVDLLTVESLSKQ